MASRAEVTVVNAGGAVQGVVRVTFPAASTIFTSKAEYGLSSTQYGAMFIPQVVTAIAASVALTAFWGMVTAGRVLFAAVQRWVSARWVYHLLPLVLAGAFLGIAALPKSQPAPVLAFGLAGLCCSALLPLTISFGQEELMAVASAVAGGVIAFYQVGYGIAALGVAPLRSSGVALSTIFGVAAAVALALGALSFVVAHLRPLPTHLHPRPAHLAGAQLAGQ
jgi:hypothetical protein